MTERPPSAGYVKDIELYQDAEDSVRVEFHGTNGVVVAMITDESMIEFLEAAEQVFDSIHAHMAQMDALLREAENEAKLRERFDVPDPTEPDSESSTSEERDSNGE